MMIKVVVSIHGALRKAATSARYSINKRSGGGSPDRLQSHPAIAEYRKERKPLEKRVWREMAKLNNK
jgi:hypothetical protein